MSDKSRRKLLKSIAAGTGAIAAGKSLPESWTRPVVDSVILPVHARTSMTVPSTGCAGESLTIDQTNVAIAVLFDGVSPASLTTVVAFSDTNPNYIVLVDLDPDDDADIVTGRGNNW